MPDEGQQGQGSPARKSAAPPPHVNIKDGSDEAENPEVQVIKNQQRLSVSSDGGDSSAGSYRSSGKGSNQSPPPAPVPPPTPSPPKKEKKVDISNMFGGDGNNKGGVRFNSEDREKRESKISQNYRRGTKHPGLMPKVENIEEPVGVRFNNPGNRRETNVSNLRRGTKYTGKLKRESADSGSENEDNLVRKASWTTASFTEIPNALEELEHQEHPSRTTNAQQRSSKEHEDNKKKHSRGKSHQSGGSDMHALLMKHGKRSKSSVLAKYFRTPTAESGTQAGISTSDWLTRLEHMLIHFFLMIFESTTDSSKLIMELMPVEASLQVEEIFQLLLKAEPDMYKELGNLVNLAENWLIISREDSEKRQKALDYVRLYMSGVKDKNYYRLPIQVRLHKLGAFIAGLNTMGTGKEAIRYPVFKTAPPLNKLRLPSPRVKPATHFSRVVANILSGRPCNDPIPSEDVYADKLGANIFKNPLHGDTEFKTYTDQKYGSLFKREELFNPVADVDAMTVISGSGDQVDRVIRREDCAKNVFCWLPKYTRSYVSNLKGNGCEVLARNDFEKGVERAVCNVDNPPVECKLGKDGIHKKGKKLYEWVRGPDGKVHRKQVGSYTELGGSGSVDSVFNDRSPRGNKGGHGKRGQDNKLGYAGKANSDTNLAKQYGSKGGKGRSKGMHGTGTGGRAGQKFGTSNHRTQTGPGATSHHGVGTGRAGVNHQGVGGMNAGINKGTGHKGGPPRQLNKLGYSDRTKDTKNQKITPVHAFRLETFSPLDGSGDSSQEDGEHRHHHHQRKKTIGSEDDAKDNKSKKRGVGQTGQGKGAGGRDRFGQRQGPGPTSRSHGQTQTGRGRGNNNSARGYGQGRGYNAGRGYGPGRGFGHGDNGDDGDPNAKKNLRQTFAYSRKSFYPPRSHHQYSMTSDEWAGEDWGDGMDYFGIFDDDDDSKNEDPNMISLNQCWEKASKFLKKPSKALVLPPAENLILYLEKKYAKARWPKGNPIATRHYPNGSMFVAQYRNGSSRVFYPHGGLAADISGPSPVTSQVLVVRDPSDGVFFFDKALLAELNSSGKGIIFGEDGVVKAQYSAIGGFKMDGIEKGQRWQWNQGGQRIGIKLNNFMSIRISDLDRIFLNFYGNSRGFLVNVASGHEVILMNPRYDGHDPIVKELKKLIRPKVSDDRFDYIRGKFTPRSTLGFVDKEKHYAHFFKNTEDTQVTSSPNTPGRSLGFFEDLQDQANTGQMGQGQGQEEGYRIEYHPSMKNGYTTYVDSFPNCSTVDCYNLCAAIN